MKRVKVTEIVGAFASEGVSYGPFQASADRPFIEVPAHLAAALNLPLHESEVQASEEAQAEGEGVITDAQASAALRADNDRLREERDALKTFVDAAQDIFLPVAGDHGQDEGGLEAMQRIVNERSSLKSELEQAQARIIVLEAIANKPALPMDALERLEAVNGISKTLAQKAVDALLAPAKGGEQA